MITQDELKENLHYDPDTGLFTWIVKRRGIKFGHVCGENDGRGYVSIKLLGVRYKAHRLAILYMTGTYPEGKIDHKNHNRADNRWCNIREVSDRENQKNVSHHAKSSPYGKGIRKKKSSFEVSISDAGIPVNKTFPCHIDALKFSISTYERLKYDKNHYAKNVELLNTSLANPI